MFMRLICSLVMLSCLALAQTARPNFSGKWQVDPVKTTVKKILKNAASADRPAPPPPPPGSTPPPEEIEHRDPQLTITIRSREDGDDYAVTYKFTTAGAENLNWSPDGETLHKSKSHWEAGKLVTDFQMLRDGKVFLEGRDIRSLADGGTVLILERSIGDSRSESQIRQVMTKTP